MEQNNQLVAVDDNPAEVKKRQDQALMFEKYLDESGLSLSFQIIFTEIIQKQITEDQVFAYTAMRLRQIGKDLEKVDPRKSWVHQQHIQQSRTRIEQVWDIKVR